MPAESRKRPFLQHAEPFSVICSTGDERLPAYLNFLNGDNPFPAPFDTPKSQAQILQAARGFFCERDRG